MPLFLVALGSLLAKFVSKLAGFFLSGGAVVFTAIASLAALVVSIVGKFDEFSKYVCDGLDAASSLVNGLQSFSWFQSSLSQSILYAFGVDTLLSYAETYILTIGTVLLFVLLGLGIAVFSVVVPLVVFRVVYWVKSQFLSV